MSKRRFVYGDMPEIKGNFEGLQKIIATFGKDLSLSSSPSYVEEDLPQSYARKVKEFNESRGRRPNHEPMVTPTKDIADHIARGIYEIEYDWGDLKQKIIDMDYVDNRENVGLIEDSLLHEALSDAMNGTWTSYNDDLLQRYAPSWVSEEIRNYNLQPDEYTLDTESLNDYLRELSGQKVRSPFDDLCFDDVGDGDFGDDFGL